jgi:hypothetical protein
MISFTSQQKSHIMQTICHATTSVGVWLNGLCYCNNCVCVCVCVCARACVRVSVCVCARMHAYAHKEGVLEVQWHQTI